MKNGWTLLVPLAVSSLVHAAEPPHGVVTGDVTDGATSAPIEGATVVLTTSVPSAIVVGARTDARGHFELPDLPEATYQVLVIFGESRKLVPRIPIAKDAAAHVAVVLDVVPEVTTIVEHAPHTPPKVIRSTVSRILPYSDYAIDHNHSEVFTIGYRQFASM